MDYSRIAAGAAVLLLAALSAFPQTGVLTYHNDNLRTGRYLNEILLKPSNVKSGTFGKRLVRVGDGPVFAQPLYLPRVRMGGNGFRNLLYFVTGHDSLYAFDADDPDPNAHPFWQLSFIDPAHGVTAVPAGDVQCDVIWPELGVIGTPVIDPAAGTLFLIAETKEPGPKYVFRLHAIDAGSGAERPGSPVEIQPPGFVPFAHKQRGALLLSNGVLYTSWSANCDLGTYHGWVMAHDPASLKLLSVFSDTPGGNGASFWNGGAGPAADEEGNIYVVSANGDFDAGAGGRNYGDSVIKLDPSGLAAIDFFSPFNQAFLNVNDLDLGSSGALLLPDEAGSAAHPHLLVTAGKEGRLYLLDRDSLGGEQVASDSRALASLLILQKPAFGSAAYFNGRVYIAPEKVPVRAYSVSGAALSPAPVAQATDTVDGLGATPSISANGVSEGILWTISSDGIGTFRAYDASNLNLLFDSNTVPADNLNSYAEFTVPTVADGKVFVGAGYGVTVYGELGADPPAVAAVTNAASFSTIAISPGSLVSLFGSGLALTTAVASGWPLPLSLADVSVTINGVTAPLLYVSPGQINAQIPFETAPGPATVVARAGGKASQPLAITVEPAAPGLFTTTAGQAAALNADGSVNQPQNPASTGTFVSLFFTGQGPIDTQIDDGEPVALGSIIRATLPASATVGGMPAQIQFAGLAPGYAGLAQMNIRVPALAPGLYPVAAKIGETASNQAMLAVKAP